MENILRKFNFCEKFSHKAKQQKSVDKLIRYALTAIKNGTKMITKTTEGTGAGVYGRRTEYFESMEENASIFQKRKSSQQNCGPIQHGEK